VVSRRAFIGLVGASTVGAALVAAGVFHDEVQSILQPGFASVPPTSDAPPVTTSMPTGDVLSNGTTWRPSLAEDFLVDAPTGAVLSAYPGMTAYESGSDTSGYGTYSPNEVLSVHDSVLDFAVGTTDGKHLVSAVLPDDYKPHLHGRVQLRYRTDAVRGYKFVALFWPSSNDWNDGEIDWPEANLDARSRPASAIPGSLNFWSKQMSFLPVQESFASTDQSEFHVATTEWTADAIRFYWDDDLVAEVNSGIPTKPMRFTLQAETWINRGAPPDDVAGHIEVDWIVIYDPVA